MSRLSKKCRAQGTSFVVTEIRDQPLNALRKAGKLEIFDGRGESLDEVLG